MIKLVIFDLDGVLVEARLIHYHALNRALKYYGGQDWEINWDEHLAKYDGLPTRRKLELLTKEKQVPKTYYDDIWKTKQDQTVNVINDVVKKIDHVPQIELLNYLVRNGYKIYVASNSILESVRCMLSHSGLINYVHRYYSNEDVRNPKPHSEIYLKCMVDAQVNPKETLIIEDSHIGRKGAYESGGHVFGVKSVEDVNLDNIKKVINKANTYKMFKPKWQGGKMNILIPMAGAGSRFEKAGYTFPKPLIEVRGKPMIQMVIENLNIDAQHIFICLESHYLKYNLGQMLNLISPNCKIVRVNGITEGAACTTLLAKEYIDNDEPLLIANSDQFINWDSNEFLYSVSTDNIDGGILTFNSVHPKWSFAKTNTSGYVVEVAEKNPISNNATVGIYYWKKGSDYVKYAKQMIEKNIRYNNEFYVCPVFNEAILDNKKFKIFPIEKMWGLGTPEDLEVFLNDKNIT